MWTKGARPIQSKSGQCMTIEPTLVLFQLLTFKLWHVWCGNKSNILFPLPYLVYTLFKECLYLHTIINNWFALIKSINKGYFPNLDISIVSPRLLFPSSFFKELRHYFRSKFYFSIFNWVFWKEKSGYLKWWKLLASGWPRAGGCQKGAPIEQITPTVFKIRS